MQDNVVVFLKAVELVGLHDGILAVLHVDSDLPEVGIALVYVVDADELFFFAQRSIFNIC